MQKLHILVGFGFYVSFLSNKNEHPLTRSCFIFVRH
jgi:hypothetical protein